MADRKSWCFAVLACGALLAGPAFAACTPPQTPSKITDGNSASEQDMVGALDTLKHYNADVTAYFKCLEFEAKQSRLDEYDMTKMHNVAMDRLIEVAQKFNGQVRIYRAKKDLSVRRLQEDSSS